MTAQNSLATPICTECDEPILEGALTTWTGNAFVHADCDEPQLIAAREGDRVLAAPRTTPCGDRREGVPTIETMSALKNWNLVLHREALYLGDAQYNRGTMPACLDLSVIGIDEDGIRGSVLLEVYGNRGEATSAYGPGYVSAPELPALRRAAVEWAHGFIASIARDLGLIPQPFERAPEGGNGS